MIVRKRLGCETPSTLELGWMVLCSREGMSWHLWDRQSPPSLSLAVTQLTAPKPPDITSNFGQSRNWAKLSLGGGSVPVDFGTANGGL